jgi:hypothetical protein
VVLSLSTAVATHVVRLPLLYGGAMVLGVAEVIASTSAAATIPDAVASPGRERANTWVTGAETLCNEFAGPFLGGLLVAASVSIALGRLDRRVPDRHCDPAPAGGSVQGHALRRRAHTFGGQAGPRRAVLPVAPARQVTEARRGAGRTPLPSSTVRMVVADTDTPSVFSSPWMRRYPQRGFSRANRRISAITWLDPCCSAHQVRVSEPYGLAR